ncbi:MAG: hypothetical protein A3J38_01190 [Gammaproteobacteria bacterium RIFCSPHIGHO2_12_FULL_45_9]|nr:MAG: hypothetical protein A3J38_01190 [Gammaproteobacteria bacterium RIFCSPHIGHO2_12_FULL_45_9]
MSEHQEGWKIAGLALLPIRFVQGWIFWGGGSRRFIYDPSKLDPHAHQWMANKLQSAMPGAILGVDHIISFILLHFDLLYASVLIFSLLELVSGLCLILGCFTRLAGITTMLISVVLMLAFGWQGATCMDEWTMAAATLAMSFTLVLSGASIYSIDNLLMKKYPWLVTRRWFRLLTSGPLAFNKFKKMALCLLALTIVFTLFTYNHYRGSIFTPYHLGPVSAGKHHITLSHGVLKRDGSITLTLYVDGGTPATPSNIIRIELLNDKNQIVSAWNADTLSLLSNDKIQNEYAYNRVHTGQYGLVAPLSAKAAITLSSEHFQRLPGKSYRLIVFTINGNRFQMPLSLSNK